MHDVRIYDGDMKLKKVVTGEEIWAKIRKQFKDGDIKAFAGTTSNHNIVKTCIICKEKFNAYNDLSLMCQKLECKAKRRKEQYLERKATANMGQTN